MIEEELLHGDSARAAETRALFDGVLSELRQFHRDEATVRNALDFLEGYYGLQSLAGLDSGNSSMRDNANFELRSYRIRGAAERHRQARRQSP